MKRLMGSIVLAVLVVFGMMCVAQATSEDDAKALAQKAAAYAKANGKDKAMAEFNNPKGQFAKGDMYISANDFNGVCLANGGNPKLVGQNHLTLKDAGGKYFMKDMVETAKTKGGGWVNYSWTNPTSKKVQAKTAWIQKVDGADYFVACGLYK